MKKLICMALATALVVCLGCGVFAAGSATNTVNTATSGTTTFTVDRSSGNNVPAKTQIATDAKGKVAIANVSSITVLDSFDLSTTAGNIDATNGTVIRFTLSGTPDANTRVMHYENNAWVDVTCGYSANYVEGKFKSLSPVALVQATVTAPAAAATGSSESSSAVAASPKTGETNYVGLAAFMAVVAGGCAYIVAKKKHA